MRGMSDLQCPATVVLLAPGMTTALRPLAGVFAAGTPPPSAAALAAAADCRLAVLDAPDAPALRRRIDELSDLHRGETIAVVAPPDLLAALLGRQATPAVVEIDSSGWTVRAPATP